jgi:hypothetical protein
MLAGNFALFIAFLAAGARPSYVLSKDKLMPKFLGKESKYGTPWLAILLMASVDAILVRWGFATLIVIDVFLLMPAHITIHVSAVRSPCLPCRRSATAGTTSSGVPGGAQRSAGLPDLQEGLQGARAARGRL